MQKRVPKRVPKARVTKATKARVQKARVIPAQAGIQAAPQWIPAFAGMTLPQGIPAFAGMTLPQGIPAFAGMTLLQGIPAFAGMTLLQGIPALAGMTLLQGIPALAGMTLPQGMPFAGMTAGDGGFFTSVQFSEATKPVTSRPYPTMLGMRRGLPISFIFVMPSSRRICAPTP